MDSASIPRIVSRLRRLLLAVLLLGSALPALAQSLQEAKQDGLVGERRDGYLGVVAPSAGTGVHALVADVNARRKANYEAIARKNGTALATVQALAAEKTLNMTAPGHYIQDENGQWVRK